MQRRHRALRGRRAGGRFGGRHRPYPHGLRARDTNRGYHRQAAVQRTLRAVTVPDPAAVSRTAVLLVNLGSPQAPTSPAVRAYLREFLWDPRVVEIPRPLWWLVLHMLILPTRPA